MAYAQLLAGVRERPNDREHRQVFADVLLDAGDPRGELTIAQLADQAPTPAVFERCVARVRAAAQNVEQLRFEAGLVTELLVDIEHVPGIDRAWLAHEPLVRLVTSLPSKDEEVAPALEPCAEVLAACRGLAITSHLGEAPWAVLAPVVAEAELEAIALTLGDVPGFAHDEGWPTVEVARLTARADGVLARVLAGLPSLRTLRLDGASVPAALAQVWTLDALEHLDLRGVELGDDALARLHAWLAARPGRSVRHERIGLGPPDLDDPFGARGLIWSRDPPLRCRVVAIPGAPASFATARGTELQVHRNDRPHWRRDLDAPITALAATATAVLVGHADGRVDRHDQDGSIESPTPLDGLESLGPIRSLHALGGDLAIVHAGGWTILRGAASDGGEDEPAALVLTRDGHARAQGTRVIVAGPAAREVELGEPVLALASDGEQIVAIAGREVWRLDDAGPVWLGARGPTGRPAITCHGELVAWTRGRQFGGLLRGTAQTSVAYPPGYSGGDDSLELALADLCALDGNAIVAALEHGGANLLTSGAAMKADEFPGEPHRRWVFVYEGQILIAG